MSLVDKKLIDWIWLSLLLPDSGALKDPLQTNWNYVYDNKFSKFFLKRSNNI